MTAYTFPNNLVIEPITELTAPELRGSRFQDGEPETRFTIGQNQFLKPMGFRLKPMAMEDCRVATEFLRARVYRNQWFWFPHPIHGNLKVRCKEWSVESLGNNIYMLDIKIAEVISV